MAVRSSMAALIARVRLLINDTAGASQQFNDQDIQDVMDESRQDLSNVALEPVPTFGSGTIQYLDYYASMGGWEDDFVLKQFLSTVVTPSSSEPIVGHWTFASTTLPPVFISGEVHDVYRAAADLLERWSVRWALSYDVGVDGQSLKRGQVTTALQALAKQYRMKQRPIIMTATRSDLNSSTSNGEPSLGATAIDYMASGDGR